MGGGPSSAALPEEGAAGTGDHTVPVRWDDASPSPHSTLHTLSRCAPPPCKSALPSFRSALSSTSPPSVTASPSTGVCSSDRALLPTLAVRSLPLLPPPPETWSPLYKRHIVLCIFSDASQQICNFFIFLLVNSLCHYLPNSGRVPEHFYLHNVVGRRRGRGQGQLVKTVPR